MPPSPPCPCSSGARYSACCAPYHRGTREAPDAEALMRSRYSAFALREVDYLWRTLHPEHPDRARPRDDWTREVRAHAQALKYPRLHVLDRQLAPPPAPSVVLFHARVFENGQDRSFVERSEFRHDGTGWRYLRGDARDPASFARPPESLTLEAFTATPSR